MINNRKLKLIIISGSPCVGKTTMADSLFYSYENSAHLYDDQVWHVNPNLIDDPRNGRCAISHFYVKNSPH